MKYFPFLLVVLTIACSTPSPKASHPVVQNNGVNIAYTDTGRGDLTLLFVHGWCINKSYWTAQVAYFSKNYRVVTIDLPGFGESGKNRTQWDVNTYAQDVDSVIAQLDLKNVVLVGHSMAGDIVLMAAIQSKDKVTGLVGVDNFKSVGVLWPEESKAAYKKAIQDMKRDFLGVALPYFDKELFSTHTPAAVKERVLADVRRSDTVIAVATMEAENIDEQFPLKTWGKPLYLINSDVIPTDTNHLSKMQIPFHIEYTKGTGHYAMIETPEDLNLRLESILALIGTGKQPAAGAQ